MYGRHKSKLFMGSKPSNGMTDEKEDNQKIVKEHSDKLQNQAWN